MEAKKSKLPPIYDGFEAAAAAYKSGAACHKGCAFCCRDAGRIDITTLEGLVIRDQLAAWPRSRQVAVKKSLAADMRRRERRQPSACPFLMKNSSCMIYAARPFACRRIYSLKACSASQHPLVSRQVMDLGAQTIRTLQLLDDNGYSGHLAYILHMLETPAFMRTYLAGEYHPEAVMAFGKTHGIIINRVVAAQ
jgi:uncharacterized protein